MKTIFLVFKFIYQIYLRISHEGYHMKLLKVYTSLEIIIYFFKNAMNTVKDYFFLF